ncbi:hypothetical protein SOASR032_25100 [Pragia fontium]|uniref:diguanylate cyclase n=1 Tax=Pragia fontium TaxID=82985 RepID=A0ABQ5LLS4_9GAMM|nr:GGDEF domain-containing protein [Pragia fontium]GKX63941.1 hypothetical protein SOASR032_25100 [Pragia fontium]
MFFEGIIINISVLIAGFYFISKLSRLPLDSRIPVGKKIQIGFFNGLLCFLLMKFSISTIDYPPIDLRHIPLLIAACYVGPLAALITAIIISISCIIISFTETGTIVAINYCIIGLVLTVCSYYIRRSIRYRAILFSIITLSFIVIGYAYSTGPNLVKFGEFTLLIALFTAVSMYLAMMLLKDLKRKKLEILTYQGQAQHDFLTSLLNKRMFDRAIRHINQYKENTVLMLIDIDYFKKVNDIYGHDAGDLVLKEIASILNAHTAYGQKVFRIGGEEFSVILIDCPAPLAKKIGEDICREVANHPFILSNGTRIRITISIGISSSGQDGDKNSLSLFRLADRALYQAKSDGRNRVFYASDETVHHQTV